jgi:peroxiredoxin
VGADEFFAARLEGRSLPDLRLPAATGGAVSLRKAGATVLFAYVYPRTGVPGRPLPAGWDQIPGARGCTAENFAFRDLEDDLSAEGATVMGLSAQPLDEQREFEARERIPYLLLNDAGLALERTLGLLTFAVDGMTLYRRLTLIVVAGRIAKVLHGELAPELHPVAALDCLRRQETT